MKVSTRIVPLALALVVSPAGTTFPGEGAEPKAKHVHGAANLKNVRPPAERTGPAGPHSTFPTVTFAPDGKLHAMYIEGDFINVSVSGDGGKTFGKAVVINPAPEKIDANGEGRPKIVVRTGGHVYVSYTQKLDKPHTGNIRFSRSTDGGRTFSAPVTINDDGLVTGHRFDALGVDPQGNVHLLWVDKRDLDKATAAGTAYAGAALYTAVSRDGGRTFSKNRKLKDNICECCRLALDFDATGTPVVVWRDILPGGMRDHSLLRITDPPTPPLRASVDDWAINACPHHGPSLSIAKDGTQHYAWYTGSDKGPGLYYARTSSDGTQSASLKFGSEKGRHPYVMTRGDDVFLTWKESLPESGSAVFVLKSQDAGKTFGTPREWARTVGGSDHPFVVRDARGEPVLSWFTDKDGYRAWPLS